MPNTAAQELRDLNDGELFERLAQAKEELFNLRFQHVTGQLENHSRLQHVKKDIARCNTELRAREIAAAEALTSPADAVTSPADAVTSTEENE